MAHPKPPVPAKADLREFHFMPLDVVQLSNSETWAMADGWQAKALVNLWCRAWHQVPAGSLPNNDRLLAAWAGVPDWGAVKEVALRGFIECADGRLYHKKLCEKVTDAWHRRDTSVTKREKHRKKMRNWRAGKAQQKQTPRDQSRDGKVTSMTGTGTGTGTRKKETTLHASDGAVPPAHAREGPPDDIKPGVTLLRCYTKLEAEIFAERRRPWPHPHDFAVATRWADDGVTCEELTGLAEPVLRRMAANGDGPPKALKYFEAAIVEARQGKRLPARNGASEPYRVPQGLSPENEERVKQALEG